MTTYSQKYLAYWSQKNTKGDLNSFGKTNYAAL